MGPPATPCLASDSLIEDLHEFAQLAATRRASGKPGKSIIGKAEQLSKTKWLKPALMHRAARAHIASQSRPIRSRVLR